MKLGLLLAAMDPNLGGVLLRGEKGTAKSTAARALAGLLPLLDAVQGCPLRCAPKGPLCPECLRMETPLPVVQAPSPFIDIPLGADEDRVTGSLDIMAAIKQRVLQFSPGLLGLSNRGILYIDETNLLPNHLTALVLDAAASGVNRVEREGISYEHPARVTLIASFNPEEGPLGPQMLDRFGLCINVKGEQNPELRALVIKRRLAYENDAPGFIARWQNREDELRRRLSRARAELDAIEVTGHARFLAAKLASGTGCQGQRGELALTRAARALAAWQGQATLTPNHLQQTAAMALGHRATRVSATDGVSVRRLLSDLLSDDSKPQAKTGASRCAEQDSSSRGSRMAQEQALRLFTPGAVKPVATHTPRQEGSSRRQPGRRNAREVNDNRGRYIRASAQRLGRSLALDATVRAAAVHQHERRKPGDTGLSIRPPDIREKVRRATRGRLLLFLVDASGSMNAAARMRETKSAVLGILMEAYQKRDRVGLVVFGGDSARELLPPTSSVEVAKRMLAELPTGGKTPLAAGLIIVGQVLQRELTQDPKLNPLVVLLTDGRPNVPYDLEQAKRRVSIQGGWGDAGYADREVLDMAQRLALDPRPRFVVVDTDTGHFHELNLCRPMAQYLRGPCTALGQITAEGVLDLVRSRW